MTEYILQKASAVVKNFFQIFKDPSYDPPHPLPPNIQTFFRSPPDDRMNALFWSTEVLSGLRLVLSKSTFLQKIQHCKTLQSPGHEFLIAYFIAEIDDTSFETGVTLDRHPDLNQLLSLLPRDLELYKHCPSQFPLASSSSSGVAMQDMGKSGECYLPAMHNVMIPAFGTWRGLERIARDAYGRYKVLNTLKDTHMSAAQFAILIELFHDFAPMYTPMYQCSWFALLFFSMVRDEMARDEECLCKEIDKRGRQLLGTIQTPPDPLDDEETLRYHYRRVCGQTSKLFN
ncbi:hypothetical protein BD769DRAFT_1383761 [Suillus cothurnatus]|nr:hypothetical protein BD769DRAFT_1383761 [Suillus cothurnatus]